MKVFLFVILLVFLVLVLPFWILLNFLGRQRSTRQLSSAEERMLADLWQLSQAMDERLASLEAIVAKPPRIGSLP